VSKIWYARRNYLVPLPEGTDLELINADLRSNCLTDQQRIMAGRADPIAARLEIERTKLGPLPPHPPEVGPMVEVLVHSTGWVRCRDQRLLGAYPVCLPTLDTQGRPVPRVSL